MAFDDDRDDFSDERAAFGAFGEFGVTSDELPSVRPWRAAWAAEQRARATSRMKIERLLRQQVLSGPAYDLLQLEFSEGLVPVVEYHEQTGWRVWSAGEERWYLLATWERKAQEWLAISDPERVTVAYQTPPLMPHIAPLPAGMGLAAPPTRFVEPPAWETPWERPHWQAPAQRPWPAACDSRLTPPPQIRVSAPPTPRRRRLWWQR